MTQSKAWEIFNYWFEHSGHWVFGVKGRDKAIEAWKLHGIESLPNYPQY